MSPDRRAAGGWPAHVLVRTRSRSRRRALARLEERTRRGDALPPGRARRCYDVAAGIMAVGDGREAAAWLRRVQDELSKEMMR